MNKKYILSLIPSVVIIFIIAFYIIQNDASPQELEESSVTDLIFDIPTEVKEVQNLGYVTVAGEKTELSGGQLKVGDTISDTVLDKKADYFDQVKTTKLSDFSGYRLVETVPSLDTPVCTKQTKQLEFAAKKFPNVTFLAISNDTPFALQRFCSANKIKNLQVLSDARTKQFGEKNSLLMKKYGLLTRAVMIVNPENKIEYIEYANEVTGELDLMNVIAKLNKITEASK